MASSGLLATCPNSRVHLTLVYDANANHDPDGDSDGTTIVVSK